MNGALQCVAISPPCSSHDDVLGFVVWTVTFERNVEFNVPFRQQNVTSKAPFTPSQSVATLGAKYVPQVMARSCCRLKVTVEQVMLKMSK